MIEENLKEDVKRTSHSIPYVVMGSKKEKWVVLVIWLEEEEEENNHV